jgi:hypothetical protein
LLTIGPLIQHSPTMASKSDSISARHAEIAD